MSSERNNHSPVTRREFFGTLARGALAVGTLTVATAAVVRASRQKMVWQINPFKCIQCGNCRTSCVLRESAVKCVHDLVMCGYCDLCTGYFYPEPNARDTGAENQLCPLGAINRRFVEDPYYEYTIDEKLCSGCGLCVEGCGSYGNGSLYLQVRHDRCLGCNTCSIAEACPAQAFIRLPAERPYVVKHLGEQAI